MAFSGFQWLPRAALAAMTLAGSWGLRPVKLDGADSTAGAPDGGEGTVAEAPVVPRAKAIAMAPLPADTRQDRPLPMLIVSPPLGPTHELHRFSAVRRMYYPM